MNNKPICAEKECQVTLNESTAPVIRKNRNTTDEIKDAIATVSTKARISVEEARVATQAVCQKLYGHHYELEVKTNELSQAKKPR